MSKIKSFTLIELIIVVIILGLASYLVVSNFKQTTNFLITPNKFKETFGSNANLYLFRNGIFIDNNKSFKINLTNPTVYNKDLDKINFKSYKNKDVIFKYSIKNGIQNSYILEDNEGIFVFKPLTTIKVKSLIKAQEVLKMTKYLPTDGNYYK